MKHIMKFDLAVLLTNSRFSIFSIVKFWKNSIGIELHHKFVTGERTVANNVYTSQIEMYFIYTFYS